MHSSNDAPISDASTPSLLEGLQAKANASIHTTAEVVKEHLDLARQAAHDRVIVARAGKRLLDEGGESVAQAVVAKKASIVASQVDRSLASSLQVAIVRLDDSLAKLKMLESSQSDENAANSLYSHLANEHEARLTVFHQVAHTLDMPASFAEMSPEECDALAIVTAKAGCATMMSRTAQSLEDMRQRTLGGVSSMGVVSRFQPASESLGAPTLLESMQDKTRGGVEKVKQAANDRFETARAGKRLLEEGGESIAHLVVAKKASLDAAEIDRDVAQRVLSAISSLEDSAAKLNALQSYQQIEGVIDHDRLAKIAGQHELRAITYREFASILEKPIGSMEMNLAEWDALSLVKVKASCETLQRRTNQGFEAIKSLAFSGCAVEANQDTLSRRMRTVCA
jgi:hypothetical protein